MDHAFTGWIDVPVVQAIEYFSGVMATFYKWGSHYAVAIGTIGLCWSAFKLANSRFTVKDFWWDTLYKWVLYILFMSIYPVATMGHYYLLQNIQQQLVPYPESANVLPAGFRSYS